VAKGTVKNISIENQSSIKIRVTINYGDNQGQPQQKSGESYCGVEFTDEEIQQMSQEEIETFTTSKTGREMKCLDVPTGGVRAYTVVIFVPVSKEKLKSSFKPGQAELVDEKGANPEGDKKDRP
jgi:hypothetical protein